MVGGPKRAETTLQRLDTPCFEKTINRSVCLGGPERYSFLVVRDYLSPHELLTLVKLVAI